MCFYFEMGIPEMDILFRESVYPLFESRLASRDSQRLYPSMFCLQQPLSYLEPLLMVSKNICVLHSSAAPPKLLLKTHVIMCQSTCSRCHERLGNHSTERCEQNNTETRKSCLTEYLNVTRWLHSINKISIN